jgi:hypothetical protein
VIGKPSLPGEIDTDLEKNFGTPEIFNNEKRIAGRAPSAHLFARFLPV